MNFQSGFFWFLVLLLFAIGSQLNAQMSGLYTLGDEQSDYTSFSDAVSDLQIQGITGDVEFRVKPGTYASVTVNNVPNPEGFHIVFAYNGTAGDSANIAGQLQVKNSPEIKFKGFCIHPTQNQIVSCVNINESNNFTLDSCKVLNIYNNEFDYNEGLIRLAFPWEGAYIVNTISRCIISSAERTFGFGGRKGSVWMNGNTITGTIVNSPSSDVRFGAKFHWTDNVFYCTSGDFEEAGQTFTGNTFYFESIFDLKIQGDLFGNTFYTDVDIRAGDVAGNTFFGDAEMKWANNADVTGNMMHGEFRTIYSHGIKISGNTFCENVSLNNDNTWFWNNLVYDSVSFTHGPGQFICNNNFHRDSRLYLGWTSGRLINNNLGKLYIEVPQIPSWTIEDNNFVNPEDGQVCCFGERPHFYSPVYDSALHARNPLLTGKGGDFYPRAKYDTDSVLRKKPCTIGANEICFSWQLPFVEIDCSDSIRLDLCTDTLVNAYWWPAHLFDDTLSANPVIYPETDVTIFLKYTDGSTIDSVQIRTQASPPVADASFSIDILETAFENKSSCADEYFWDFGDGTFSTEESPVHLYKETGNYNCTLTAKNELGEDEFSMNILLTSLGVQDEEDGFRLFPNPAKQSVNIYWEKGFSEVIVFDVFGKAVYIENSGTRDYLRLNIGQFPEGVYFLKLKGKGGARTQAFVKSR